MIDSELLGLLCCPETRQAVGLADSATLDQLNQKIARGDLRNRAGRTITEKLTEGLIRSDGKLLYPVRNDIPVMLIDEAVELDGN